LIVLNVVRFLIKDKWFLCRCIIFKYNVVSSELQMPDNTISEV